MTLARTKGTWYLRQGRKIIQFGSFAKCFAVAFPH